MQEVWNFSKGGDLLVIYTLSFQDEIGSGPEKFSFH